MPPQYGQPQQYGPPQGYPQQPAPYGPGVTGPGSPEAAAAYGTVAAQQNPQYYQQ
jgi:hypothetical protein